MKRHNKTLSIQDLLSDSQFNSKVSKNKINNVIKHSTIFSFWNNVVGIKFARHTKPYAIKSNKLYVSSQSPAIIQELNLYKFKLISKINSYSVPLGIEITDIIFNYKNYCSTVPDELKTKDDIPIEINQEEINNTMLDENIQKQFREKVDKLNFLNNNQKNSLLDKILNSKKAEIIRKNLKFT